ncbi:HEAT repeat domain-containing protein [Streptomyces sp. ME19-01-6]|uniref:HEAT repeat domain-containing protein n=1 Tax=Streptomyces sp. ME19-01-6 TaxID=3028686 RepID=UPI0029A32B73|nr:HEAT repeat domain-containing protein [Streptomyces sp. ME19-01-6]MDX3233368.1 HEAT repeat domain-containing protein [Streptomyces sp. ME19-01-6]
MSEAIDALIRDLSDQDRAVRRAAEDGLVALGAQSIDPLLPYVRDGRRGSPRFSAESVLKRLGDQALPRLREIRRHGPGRLRGKALETLVDLGGTEALDDADRRAVERLVRIKLLDELPVRLPLDAGRWLAFPADRLDDAVSALGLHDLRPVTTVLGVDATTRADDAMDFQDSQGEKQRAYRVFITPEFENWGWWRDLGIKNWRMVWGNSFVDECDGFGLADTLSERCGEAHFYVIDPYHSGSVWYVARDGRRVRSYGTYDYPEFRGKPLPFELSYMEDAEKGIEDEEYAKGVPHADVAADNLSVQPGPMDAEHTHGHGWLATTHPDLPNSRFKGALPI